MSEVYTAKKLSPLRKVIAARMTEAKQTIPHFRLVADIEVDRLMTLRERMNQSDRATKISINDCMIKACASSLMKHPEINVQFLGEEIHEFHQADISIVIAIEGGLVAPVLRAADRKTVHDIAVEVKILAARASAGQLKMNEIVGGSFSISNLGAYGVQQFDAVINPPQCSILAIGCAKPRMVVTDSGQPRVATTIRVTLSVDHRAIDGVAAAKFIATVRQSLEEPDGLFA